MNWPGLNPVAVPGNSGMISITTGGDVIPAGNIGYGMYLDGITFLTD